jgi:hypothetical protein
MLYVPLESPLYLSRLEELPVRIGRRLGYHQSRSECGDEEENPCLWPESNPVDYLIVTLLDELSGLRIV